MALVGVALLGAFASDATAVRKPTRSEMRHLRRAALKECRHGDYHCRFNGAVVSSINPRYARTRVTGYGYMHLGIARRPHRHGVRWHVLRIQGGGIGICGYYYAVAPRRIVHEFGYEGFNPNVPGAIEQC